MSNHNSSFETESVDDLLLDYDEENSGVTKIDMSEECKNIVLDFEAQFTQLAKNFTEEFYSQNYSDVFETLILDGEEYDSYKEKISQLEATIDELKDKLGKQETDTRYFKELSHTIKSDYLQSKTNNKI